MNLLFIYLLQQFLRYFIKTQYHLSNGGHEYDLFSVSLAGVIVSQMYTYTCVLYMKATHRSATDPVPH